MAYSQPPLHSKEVLVTLRAETVGFVTVEKRRYCIQRRDRHVTISPPLRGYQLRLDSRGFPLLEVKGMNLAIVFQLQVDKLEHALEDIRSKYQSRIVSLWSPQREYRIQPL